MALFQKKSAEAAAATAPASGAGPLPASPVESASPGMAGGAGGASSVAKHGGTPSGKIGTGGTVPGTPEHKEAVREAERVRKADYRARQRAKNPPVLPMALPPALPSAGAGAAGEAPPVAPVQSGGFVPAAVPWNPDPLRELAVEIVALAEQGHVASQTTKALKAGLPKPMLEAVEKNSRWNPAIKTTIATTAPPEVCKAMEMAGISGAYQNLTVLGLSLTALVFSLQKSSADTDKLIAEFNNGKPKEEPKP